MNTESDNSPYEGGNFAFYTTLYFHRRNPAKEKRVAAELSDSRQCRVLWQDFVYQGVGHHDTQYPDPKGQPEGSNYVTARRRATEVLGRICNDGSRSSLRNFTRIFGANQTTSSGATLRRSDHSLHMRAWQRSAANQIPNTLRSHWAGESTRSCNGGQLGHVNIFKKSLQAFCRNLRSYGKPVLFSRGAVCLFS